MSGMASDASTTPGSVATLASCSSERSRSIAASNWASANTRAGTRMPGTVPIGSSHSSSSMRRVSYIEDHAGKVPLAAALECQPVIGHCLDQRRRLVDHAGNGRAQADAPELQLDYARGDESLRLGHE